ncbi:hypothetical protein G6O69_01055 [Pseudenhygromyxa sp. WMMC2535]|nr:hypothetical protein [Pseudenhygromyxa sp. WMMC2535]
MSFSGCQFQYADISSRTFASSAWIFASRSALAFASSSGRSVASSAAPCSKNACLRSFFAVTHAEHDVRAG